MARRVGARPVWLSTAGAGVSWLHVRLDDRPKYYGCGPYRQYAEPLSASSLNRRTTDGGRFSPPESVTTGLPLTDFRAWFSAWPVRLMRVLTFRFQ